MILPSQSMDDPHLAPVGEGTAEGPPPRDKGMVISCQGLHDPGGTF